MDIDIPAFSAYETLKAQILTCQIQPFATLKVRQLAIELNTSPTPIREALTRLHAEKFVTAETNKGFRAAGISYEELLDLEKSRAIIEVELLRASVLEGDENWEIALVGAHYKLSKCTIPNPKGKLEVIEAWELAHHQFHENLTNGAKSKWLKNISQQINTQLQRYRRYILINLEMGVIHSNERTNFEQLKNTTLGIKSHTDIMDATLNRDEDKAVRLMREHVKLAGDAYLQLANEIGISA